MEKTLVTDESKCGKPAAPFIPRWGMSWACVLPKGHTGEHERGGNCFKHGEYVGAQCPQWPTCLQMEGLDIDGDEIVASRGLNSPQLQELLKHIRWMESHAKLRIEQTRGSTELNAFNQGRADAVESLIAFAEHELRIKMPD